MSYVSCIYEFVIYALGNTEQLFCSFLKTQNLTNQIKKNHVLKFRSQIINYEIYSKSFIYL